MVIGQVQGLFLGSSVVFCLIGIEGGVESDAGVVNARVFLLDGIEGSKDFVVQVGGGQFGGIVFILIARRVFIRAFVLVLFLDCIALENCMGQRYRGESYVFASLRASCCVRSVWQSPR
jgi:hypothetical protein